MIWAFPELSKLVPLFNKIDTAFKCAKSLNHRRLGITEPKTLTIIKAKNRRPGGVTQLLNNLFQFINSQWRGNQEVNDFGSKETK